MFLYYIFPNQKFQVSKCKKLFSEINDTLLDTAEKFKQCATDVGVATGSLAGITAGIYEEAVFIRANI